MASEFELHRLQVETLLKRVEEQLIGADPDRIRSAVKNRHGDWLPFIRDTRAEVLGRRFIAALEDADRDLTAEEVLELEWLIDEILPTWP